jgi:uncharacterized protein (UPF0332 family)
MSQAGNRAAIAKELLASGHLEVAVSASYYSMLYAANAVLAKHGEHPWTDTGTWHLFHERYVATGAFDLRLHTLAQGAQDTREKGDYEAITPTRDEAEKVVDGAAEYIAAVESMLDAQAPGGERADQRSTTSK